MRPSEFSTPVVPKTPQGDLTGLVTPQKLPMEPRGAFLRRSPQDRQEYPLSPGPSQAEAETIRALQEMQESSQAQAEALQAQAAVNAELMRSLAKGNRETIEGAERVASARMNALTGLEFKQQLPNHQRQ